MIAPTTTIVGASPGRYTEKDLTVTIRQLGGKEWVAERSDGKRPAAASWPPICAVTSTANRSRPDPLHLGLVPGCGRSGGRRRRRCWSSPVQENANLKVPSGAAQSLEIEPLPVTVFDGARLQDLLGERKIVVSPVALGQGDTVEVELTLLALPGLHLVAAGLLSFFPADLGNGSGLVSCQVGQFLLPPLGVRTKPECRDNREGSDGYQHQGRQ